MKTGVIITGAAGFVGSHLARRILKDTDYHVYGVDDLSCGFEENIKDLLDNDRFDFVIRNVRNLTQDDMFHDIDDYMTIEWKYVFHLAARGEVYWCRDNPREAVDINVNGTINMLELAKGFKIDHFYFADTSAEYDSLTKEFYYPSSELMAPNIETPMGFYPITKMAASQFVRSYGKKNGFGTTLFRYTNIYGPSMNLNRDIPPVIGSFVNKLLFEKTNVVIYGNGQKRRDFLHIDDLTDFHMAALDKRKLHKDTKTYNAGFGKNWSIHEIFYKVYTACQKITDEKISHTIEFKPNQPDEATQTLADIVAAKKDLGWSPKIDIDTGIEKTVFDLVERYNDSHKNAT